MEPNASPTEIFYHLLDLAPEEQRRCLAELQERQPETYRQLQPLLEASELADSPLTRLLGFHARQLMEEEISFTGHQIDKYKICHEIGRGGMGVVYSAERCDKTFEQQLAVKFIQPSLTDVLGKAFLFQEAQLLARLNHPYIAKVFDGGEYRDFVYIVMEKVDGQTLLELIESNTLDLKGKLQLFVRICQAIQHAHQNQILHADIKPENVLVDETLAPKILDFNITQKQPFSASDLPPLLAFSEAFASPEQKAGTYLTQQSDVFSLGKLLAFMVGTPPKGSDLSAMINKATRHDAAQRYGSVTELMTDTNHILTRRPISLKADIPLYVTKKLIQRRPVQSVLSLCLLLSAVGFSTALIQKNHQLEREKAIAENMMFEVTSLLFHSKGDVNRQMSVQNMLELTRRRILSNPDLPQPIKQKMLLAMMTPVPDKQQVKAECWPDCTKNN